MSDFAGSPLFSLVQNNKNLRQLFIDKIDHFASTVNALSSIDLLMSMLKPLFESANLSKLYSSLEKKMSKEVIVSLLNEASSSVKEDESSEGILFGLVSESTLNIYAFDFTTGTAALKKVKLDIPEVNEASRIFVELKIKEELGKSAKESRFTALIESSLMLL